MTLSAALLLLGAVLVTATVSGVLGMAGGLLLMGALLLVLPTATAFVVHGLVQVVSNGYRAVLHRGALQRAVLGWYAVGAALALGVLALVAVVPPRPVVLLALGLLPLLVWLPSSALRLDASRPAHAVVCGAAVTAVNLVAGVAGPLLDVFFVRSALSRHAVVATKAATQVLSHLAKVVLYGGLLGSGTGVPWLVVALALPLSVLGTTLGGRLLDRLTDTGFRELTRWTVTAIGGAYLVQAALLL